jgi:pilus assembly protein CpaC
VSDIPYLGVMFRRVHEESNEVELLIMVTPELVEAIDADKVPPCGPGSRTTSPNDWELYMRGYMEVPNCCPTGPIPPRGLPGGPAPGMIFGNPESVLAPVPSPPLPKAPVAQPLDTSASGTTWPVPGRSAGLSKSYNPPSPNSRKATSASTASGGLPGFMGPIGYDAAP